MQRPAADRATAGRLLASPEGQEPHLRSAALARARQDVEAATDERGAARNQVKQRTSELEAIECDGHVFRAQRRVRDMIRGLLADAAEAGHVRSDVTSNELAGYCEYALRAAGTLPSEAAVRRLVAVILAGLRSG
ncbi:SbtR family transcriptional regulator [Nonomuraea sp. NPDC003707]